MTSSTSTSIHQRAQLIKAEFSMLNDWEERFALLIEKGRNLPRIEDGKKSDDSLVPGCQSRLWLVSRLSSPNGEPRIILEAESDSQIVNGLAALIVELCSDSKPSEVTSFDIDGFVEELSLKGQLTANRRGGLTEMIRRVKEMARCASESPECQGSINIHKR